MAYFSRLLENCRFARILAYFSDLLRFTHNKQHYGAGKFGGLGEKTCKYAKIIHAIKHFYYDTP
jgi:hypothetical protein